MSELTPCNKCNWQLLESAALARGATATKTLERMECNEGIGNFSGWWVVRVSDQPEPVAYLLEMPDRCVCG